ncbi:MAG: hypothetical protein WBA28_09065 [Microbacteriaceae bacterium]
MRNKSPQMDRPWELNTYYQGVAYTFLAVVKSALVFALSGAE